MSKKSARNSRAAAPRQARQDSAAPFASKYGGEGRDVPENTEQPAPNFGEAGGGGVKSLVLWLSAFILIASGYGLLHKADPGGQNIWAIVSPALLLCGYLLIIPAIARTYPKK